MLRCAPPGSAIMQRRPLAQRVGHLIATLAGWRVLVPSPPPARCVVLGAPHTSGWDLALTLLLMLAAGIRLRWVGKESLFRGPVGPVLRGLGGLPVRRKGRNDFVAQMAEAFAGGEDLMLAILPEGTRGKTAHWKTGFYYIALAAGVPIVLGYADYRRRLVGLGPTLEPSGDIHADFVAIKAFYAGITGRHPALQGPIALAPDQSR
jgi:1-acyl-sn-glycerol-3-phosphate acyltransferase